MANDAGRSVPDGLSSATPMEPQASPPKASIPSARGLSKKRRKQLAQRRKHRHLPKFKERLYMVFLEGGGMPTVCHESFKEAAKEAARLAHFNRDQRFHILGSVRICSKASAIEARSDATAQTGAAEGESAGPKDDAQPTQSEASNG